MNGYLATDGNGPGWSSMIGARMGHGMRAVFYLAVFGVGGCGYSIRDHAELRRIHPGIAPASYVVDLDASSVECSGNGATDEEDARELRDLTAKLLQIRARTPAEAGEQAPSARFRASFTIDRTVWPRGFFWACLDDSILHDLRRVSHPATERWVGTVRTRLNEPKGAFWSENPRSGPGLWGWGLAS